MLIVKSMISERPRLAFIEQLSNYKLVRDRRMLFLKNLLLALYFSPSLSNMQFYECIHILSMSS